MVTEDFWLEEERVLLDDLLLLDVFDSLTEVGISQGNELFVVVDVEFFPVVRTKNHLDFIDYHFSSS